MSQESFFFFLIYSIFFAFIVSFFIIIIKLIFNLIKAIFRKFFPVKAKIENKNGEEKSENIYKSKQQIADSGLNRPFNAGSKKEEQEKKSAIEFETEQGEKEIAEQLNKLKRDSSDEKETAESKMPSRDDKDQDSEGDRQKIEIPKAQKFSESEKNGSVETEDEPGKYFVKDTSAFKKTGVTTSYGAIHPTDVLPKEKILKTGSESEQKYENSSPFKDNLVSRSKKEEKQNNSADTSIFKGKSEVSRTDLRQKLRKDPEIWKAQKQVGLNLSPIERAKLEKEVFSQAYGRNISKTDLRWGIKKLNQKMLGEKNITEKGKIRKEIKFFKKIGGIKE